MRNSANWSCVGKRAGLLSALAGLILPGTTLAQTQTSSSFRLMDFITLCTLLGVGFIAWQWQRRIQQDRKTQDLLHRVLERRAGGADGPLPDGASLDEIRASQSQQRLMSEGIQDALVMSISRLDELRKETQVLAGRLAELRASAQESAALTQTLQRLHKDAVTGLERVYVTQSGLVSTLEGLKASERRDSSVLSELRAGLSLLNARMLERLEPDRSQEPTVIGSPDEVARPAAVVNLSPIQDMLDLQTQTLEAQFEMIEGQGSTLSRLAKEFERQELERGESLQLLQAVASEVKGLEQRFERLERIEQGMDRLGRLEGGLDRLERIEQGMDRLERIEQGLDRLEQFEQSLDQLHRLGQGLEHIERLEEQNDALSEQLGELQADVGLVLKARPMRGAGRARSPYDIALADEYYANLQKLVRGLMKNEKASTYALEAAQYLYESLQVQGALCELLSSSEFTLRVSPASLEEGVAKPLASLLGQKTTPPESLAQKSPTPSRPLLAPRPNGSSRTPYKATRREEPELSLDDLEALTQDQPDWEQGEENEGQLPVRIVHSH